MLRKIIIIHRFWTWDYSHSPFNKSNMFMVIESTFKKNTWTHLAIDKLGAIVILYSFEKKKYLFQSDKVNDVDKKYVFYIIRLSGWGNHLKCHSIILHFLFRACCFYDIFLHGKWIMERAIAVLLYLMLSPVWSRTAPLGGGRPWPKVSNSE